MKWLDQLERKMGRHYIPDLMKILCTAMLGVFVLEYLPLARSANDLLYFNRALILRGEIWRVLSFVFLPPSGSIFFILLSLYFYYFLGSGLESRWGSRRFNLYYLIGVLGNIIAGFITGYATNEYLNTTLLLAFAVMYPDVEFMLFFILPVKAKWFGLISGLGLVLSFLGGSWAMRIALIFSVLPFLLFFGRDAWLQLKMTYRHIMYKLRK